MNLKGMLRPVAFGRGTDRKPADKTPSPFTLAKVASRRLAALAEAGDVLKFLPAIGESLHAIMTGRYDLTDLLEVIIKRSGRVAHLRIATLSFNRGNVQALESWLKAGAVKRLTVLCSLFFFEHNPDLFRELQQMLAAHGKRHRLGAARNHCKVVCLDVAGQLDKYALEGSANLRTNSNREQFCLVNDAELHAWHAQWIDEAVHGSQINEK